MPDRDHTRRLGARDVAAPVDQLHHVAGLVGRSARLGCRPRGLPGHATMAEQHPGCPQACGDQFLEPHGRGGVPPGEFGHEGDASLVDTVAEQVGLRGVDGQGDRRVDRLAMVAGGQNGRDAVPLLGKAEQGIDVVPRGERPKAIHRDGTELHGRPLGPVRHLLANSPHLEAVGERSQGGQVPRLPVLAETDDPDAELHVASPNVTASAAKSSRSRRSPLSEMSFRHQPPSQRIARTPV